MVIGLLGDQRHLRHETERGDEIVEQETARDRVARFVIIPFVEVIERAGPRLFVQLLDHADLLRLALIGAAPYVARTMEQSQSNGLASGLRAPDAAAIEAIAIDALNRLPAAFRAHLGDVVIRIEDFADDDILAEMGIEDPFDLTGLYSGRPIGEKSSAVSGALPDIIHLFRRPILDEWAENGETIEHLVTHVLIHEIGHHFGLSDEDMHRLEDDAE